MGARGPGGPRAWSEWPFWGHFGTFLGHFGTFLGHIGTVYPQIVIQICCEIFLGQYWDILGHLGDILGQFWDIFGTFYPQMWAEWSGRTTGVVRADHRRGPSGPQAWSGRTGRTTGVLWAWSGRMEARNPKKQFFFQVFVLPQNVSKRVLTRFPDPVDPKYTTYGPSYTLYPCLVRF